ncbi:hypothetical protein RSK20926_19767 [Roseobacter sp. SK209-2-6]|nr:hypothetical protein RSK20926_19767 [Roseobacter sp. SK209-2-6]
MRAQVNAEPPIESLPELRVAKTRFRIRRSRAENEKPFTKRGKRFAAYLEQLPMSTGELRAFLHFVLATARRAEERSQWIGGRFLNFLFGQDPCYIPMNWRQLQQTCDCLGQNPLDLVCQPLSKGDKYELRSDIARAALVALQGDQGRRANL